MTMQDCCKAGHKLCDDCEDDEAPTIRNPQYAFPFIGPLPAYRGILPPVRVPAIRKTPSYIPVYEDVQA